MTGEMDYLLMVRVGDIGELFSRFMMETHKTSGNYVKSSLLL